MKRKKIYRVIDPVCLFKIGLYVGPAGLELMVNNLGNKGDTNITDKKL